MKTIVTLALIVGFATGPVLAHHGKDGFDDVQITLSGTVMSLTWVNPHVQVVLEVRKTDGSVGKWTVDLSPPNAMTRGKFSRDDVKAGTMLTVTGFPTADGTRMTARSITYPDGRVQTTSNEFFKPLDRNQLPIVSPGVR